MQHNTGPKQLLLGRLMSRHFGRGTGAGVSWTVLERIASAAFAFLGTLLVSRYLGPSDFGILSYVLAVFAIVNIIAQVGLSALVVRDFSSPDASAQEILSTTLGLRILGSLFACIGLFAFALFWEGLASPALPLILSVSVVLALRPTDVFDFWLQSKAKFVDLAKFRFSASVVGFAVRVLLILIGSGLAAFALPAVAQALVLACLLLWAFHSRSPNLRARPTLRGGLPWLRQSWLLMLSSLAAIVYLKIDQIMLKELVGADAVGVYAVAASLSESWYLFPGAVVTALFPKLVTLKSQDQASFEKAFQKLLDGLFLAALLVAVATQLLASTVIEFLFGAPYAPASKILEVHIWSGVFVFMREAFSRWILIEGVLKFSLITHGLGMIFNVGLNIFLIPLYQGVGAAYATLLSYAMAAYLSLIFHSGTRPVFFMMSRSILFPFRLILARGKSL